MATDANGRELKVGDEVKMVSYGVVKRVYDELDGMMAVVVVALRDEHEPDRYLHPSEVVVRCGNESSDLTVAELVQAGSANRTI